MAKRVHEVIELSDDDEPVAKKQQQEVVDLSDTESDTESPYEEIEDTLGKDDSVKDQRQAMRELLAAAAERRIARIVDEQVTVTDAVNLTPVETATPSKPAAPVESAKSLEPVKLESIPQLISPIHVYSNPSYASEFAPSSNKDTISMSDLIGSPILEKTWQFNFCISCDFLLPYIKADPLNVELVLVCNEDDEHLQINQMHRYQYRIKTIDVSKRLHRFGSHHTKMMVNLFQDDTCQVVVHTMNLLDMDYKGQTQMVWMSPRLQKLSRSDRRDYLKANLDPINDNGTIFKLDLIRYLQSYDEPKLQELIGEVEQYDFTPVDVQFVASVPGYYKFNVSDEVQYSSGNEWNIWGYGKLYQWLKVHRLTVPTGQLIGQPSTIASPFDQRKSNILTHLLTSIAQGSNELIKDPDHKFDPAKEVVPVIVWPTVKEILRAHYSYHSGIALHFSIARKGNYTAYSNQWANIKQYFHRWASIIDSKQSKAGRSNLSPHVKTYALTRDNFKTLEWFLLTSANMSSQAWGAPIKPTKTQPKDQHKYRVASYEAGVLINPMTTCGGFKKTLVPVYGRDTLDAEAAANNNNNNSLPVRLPYDTPLTKYAAGDEPWTTAYLQQCLQAEQLYGNM